MITSERIVREQVVEQTSDLSSLVRRYLNKYLNLDSGWGFWDETLSCFYSGYASDEVAYQRMIDYDQTVLGNVGTDEVKGQR